MIHTGDYIRLTGKVPGQTSISPNDLGLVIDENPSQRGYVKAMIYGRGAVYPLTLLISSRDVQTVTPEYVSAALSEFKFRNLEVVRKVAFTKR